MATQTAGFSTLYDDVISKGLCTACGTCVGVCPTEAIAMGWVEGDAEPYLAEDVCSECGLCVQVCPGKQIPLLELEGKTFGRRRNPRLDPLGVCEATFSVCACSAEVRRAGAAGGAVTAVLMYALDAGVIDGAIVGGFDDHIPCRPEGKIVTRSEYLPRYGQSKYGGNPPLCAELSRAVNDLGIKRIGIIGCPCHVHALRKIQANGQPSGIADSLTLVLGLFCAAQFYFEGTRHILRELCGVESLDDVAQIGYREGDWPGRFCVRTKSGKEILLDRHEYVYHQLLPLWQRDRCMMCLDHTAELADVSFGDYWIPGSKPGDAGWSLAIARNARGIKLLADAAGAGYIVKEQVSIGEASGAEFKKHRSPFVLQRRRRYGLPVPQYDYTADYEPGGRKTIHRAPAFDQLVVEKPGSRTSAADSGK